jgi:hypothetical protein
MKDGGRRIAERLEPTGKPLRKLGRTISRIAVMRFDCSCAKRQDITSKVGWSKVGVVANSRLSRPRPLKLVENLQPIS